MRKTVDKSKKKGYNLLINKRKARAERSKEMKALPIEVYKDGSGYDCTNGGISSTYDILLLICSDGFIEIDENNLPENLVKIVKGTFFGRSQLHIEPVARPTGVGYLAGGNIGYTFDCRFHRLSPYPLPIFDRQETQEVYDELSR